MSGHTPRRLKVHHDHGWLVISDDTDDLYIKVAKGLGASVDKDNARRLVACWNACEGIDTYALELMTGDLSISNQITAIASRKPKGKKTAYRTQRDELLAALKAMLTHMGMDEDEWNKPTFDQARAAIAKVEQP